MKTHTVLVSALALFGLATAAKADHGRVNFEIGGACPAPVVAVTPPARAPSYLAAGNTWMRPAGFARGHWEDVTTKTWIPERWTMARDRWGRPVKVLEKGYFAFRTERVWVEDRPFVPDHRGWNR